MTVRWRRPVVAGFNPDPSICRVGDDYYLACSSFEYMPGVPIYRSSDLVNWTHMTNVLTRCEQLDVTASDPSDGIYAPTLRHRDGVFWLITTHSANTDRQVLAHAADPLGPWTVSTLRGIAGIDPDLAWDEQGQCHVTFAGHDPATGSLALRQVRLDPTMSVAVSEAVTVWAGDGGQYPEAPHLHYVDGWWFLLAAEGGTEGGHSVTVARSRSICGPFEGCASNPILTMRGVDSIVQNTGHADLVQRPDGTWVMVLLGIRPAGWTPGWHVLGRETFAAEVGWSDGWPRPARALESSEPQTEDRTWTFSEALGPEWFSPSAEDLSFARPTAAGLVITARHDARLLAQRLRHQRARIELSIEADRAVGGVALRIDPTHELAVHATGDRVEARARIGSLEVCLGSAAREEGPIHLRIDVTDPAGQALHPGPDQVVVHARPDSETGWTELGRLDGRYLSTEVAGGFTGRVFGILVESGELTVRSLRYRGWEASSESPTQLDIGVGTFA